MDNYTKSYWEKVLFQQNYDLVVVGAGLTGQSVAMFYKSQHPDARVLILDRGTFPIGASTRNAGFACIGTIGEHLADLEIEEESKLKERIKARFSGLQLLRSTLGDQVIDYVHSGAHEIFTDQSEFETAKTHINRFNAWMSEIIDESEMYSATEYQGFPAIHQTQEGMLHPGKMIGELIRRNIASGIEYRWNTEVSEFDKSGWIKTPDGIEIEAGNIVFATNAFTKKLLPEMEIQPGRGFVFITKKLENLDWKGTFHHHKGYVYFRDVGNERLLLGGARHVDLDTETTADFGVNKQIKEYLIQFANDILKLPSGWEIEQEWSGVMGFTPTKSPVLKQISNNLLVVSGLSGMGVALGMQLGKSAAELLD